MKLITLGGAAAALLTSAMAQEGAVVSTAVTPVTVVNPQSPAAVVTVVPQQVVTVVPQQAVENVLRVGAPVPVALSEELTTKGKRLRVGQIVRLEVAQDVMLNGRLVIPARSPVEGV